MRAEQPAALSGCYEAARAAALSGVPLTTVYWWARHGIVVPSISPVREKLWSYADLMALRIVSWLRHPKVGDERPLPGSPMLDVRRALALLDDLGLDVWAGVEGGSPILVAPSGEIFVKADGDVLNLHRQPVLMPAGALALPAPFAAAGLHGPDLVRPPPHLRIIPAKVAGEPHLDGTRITTQAVLALAARGFSEQRIAEMYEVDSATVAEGIDLERELAGDLAAA